MVFFKRLQAPEMWVAQVSNTALRFEKKSLNSEKIETSITFHQTQSSGEFFSNHLFTGINIILFPTTCYV